MDVAEPSAQQQHEECIFAAASYFIEEGEKLQVCCIRRLEHVPGACLLRPDRALARRPSDPRVQSFHSFGRHD